MCPSTKHPDCHRSSSCGKGADILFRKCCKPHQVNYFNIQSSSFTGMLTYTELMLGSRSSRPSVFFRFFSLFILAFLTGFFFVALLLSCFQCRIELTFCLFFPYSTKKTRTTTTRSIIKQQKRAILWNHAFGVYSTEENAAGFSKPTLFADSFLPSPLPYVCNQAGFIDVRLVTVAWGGGGWLKQ